ncbi:hypothetical protein DL93DRAFT_2166209 [Clavulina sp. PMI_390]|nr:hypothetical protein DL93DRAFT_2166209 [Clavulina sp. PMI_390]
MNQHWAAIRDQTASLLRGASQRLGNVQLSVIGSSRKVAGSGKDVSQQGLAGLPMDIIIAIFCEELQPRDLIAVSHTCRILFICASAKIVWIHAWPRASELLNPLEPLDLVLPQADWLVRATVPEGYTPAPTTVEPITWLSGYDPARTSLIQGDYRARYVDIMRVRHQLRQPIPTMEPLALAMHDIPYTSNCNTKLIHGGEILVCWLKMEVQIYDIKRGMRYTVLLAGNNDMRYDVNWPMIIDARVCKYEGIEGILIVAPFFKANVSNIFFQPFAISLADHPGSLKHLGDIEPRGKSAWSILDSHYLIFRDTVGSTGMYRIVDLRDGAIRSVYPPRGCSYIQLYKEEFVFFIGMDGNLFIAQLNALNANPELSPKPELWLQVDEVKANFRIIPFLEAQFDPVSSHDILPVWYLGDEDMGGLGLPCEIFLRKMGEPYVDPADGSIQSRSISDSSEYSAPFTHSLLPNGGLPANRNPTTRNRLSAKLSTHFQVPVSRYPARTNDTSGRSKLLSRISWVSNFEGCSDTAIVMTELHRSGTKIIHKPLNIRHRRASRSGRNADALEQLADPYGGHIICYWSEISGRIAVQRSNEKARTYAVTIYQF